MSTTPATRPARPVRPERLERLERLQRAQGPRRVRHQARDVVAVMTFSAGASIAVAAVLMLAGGILGSGR